MLGFLGLFGNPLLIFIAIFVYLAASSEAHLVATRAMSRGVPVTSAMMTQFATLTPDEHVDAAVRHCCAPARASSRSWTDAAGRWACSAATT